MIARSVARADMHAVHRRHLCVAQLSSEKMPHVLPRQKLALPRRESLAIMIASLVSAPFAPASDAAAPSKAAKDWAAADDDGAPQFFKTPNGLIF